MFRRLLLLSVCLSAPAFAQEVVLRPIDQATVRILAIEGMRFVADEGAFVQDGGHGSGVSIGDGIILTANHVIADADILLLMFPGDERPRAAKVIATNAEQDLAILRVSAEVPAAIPLSTRPPRLSMGEAVSVSGYPLDFTETTPAAASGQLSRVRNDGTLELSISLNPGNSGGPVINSAGELVGIVSARGNVQRGVQGIGFVAPISQAAALLNLPSTRSTLARPAQLRGSQLHSEGFRSFRAEAWLPPSTEGALMAHGAWAEAAQAIGAPDFPAVAPTWLTDLLEQVRVFCEQANSDRRLAERYSLPALAEATRMFTRALQLRAPAPAAQTAPTNAPPVGIDSTRAIDFPANTGEPKADVFNYREPAGIPRLRISPRPLVVFSSFMVGFSAAIHVDVLQFKYAQLFLGATGMVGAWTPSAEGVLPGVSDANGLPLFGGVAGDIGLRLSFPTDSGAAFFEGMWGPGYLKADGLEHVVTRRYHISAGIRWGFSSFGVGYSEQGRGESATLRVLSIEWGIWL